MPKSQNDMWEDDLSDAILGNTVHEDEEETVDEDEEDDE